MRLEGGVKCYAGRWRGEGLHLLEGVPRALGVLESALGERAHERLDHGEEGEVVGW